jgi:tetratricopeptide (TPR) repeat protein
MNVIRRPATAGASILLISCALAPFLMTYGCARTPEQKYARFLERGKTQLQKRQYQRAILEFRNAIQAKPKNAEAYYQLAEAYLGQKDIRGAVPFLWKAIELDPKYTAAQVQLAKLAAVHRDPAEVKEAEKILKRVLATSTADPDALNTLAFAEWRLGKREDAEKVLNQAATQFPQNLSASVNLAKIKFAEKDPAGAEAILKRAAESNPGSADAAVTLGQFYMGTGRLQDAEQQFRRALQINGKHGLALVSIAEIQTRAGQTDQADQLYKQAASLSDPQYKPVHAMFLFRSGKRDLAITEFEKLAKEDPADRDARFRLIAAYRAVNKPQDAEKLLSDALKKNPKDIDALLQRSQGFVRDGKFALAQTDLATVLHFQPDSPAAHYLLAKVYQKTGATLRARQEFTEALRLNPELLNARLELAELLITNKAAKTALEVLNETPESQKAEIPVLIESNWARLGMGDWAEARKGIDQVLQIASKNPQALVQDGTLNLTQRKFAAARVSFEEALKENSDDFKTLDLLVQSYNFENQMPAAVERIRRQAAERPNSAPVQFFCGQLMARTGNREEARKAFAAAKAADPGLTAAEVSLARLDAADGKLDDARKRLSGLLVQAPTDIQARLVLAAVEDRARNRPAAIEQYRQVLAVDDSNLEALNNLAYLLAETDKQYYEEALKFAQKAEELAPDNAAVQGTLGWVLYRKGLYSMAIPYLEQSAATQPTGLRKGHLAVAYLKSGNQRKGEDLLQAALKMDPSLSQSDFMREVPAAK